MGSSCLSSVLQRACRWLLTCLVAWSVLDSINHVSCMPIMWKSMLTRSCWRHCLQQPQVHLVRSRANHVHCANAPAPSRRTCRAGRSWGPGSGRCCSAARLCPRRRSRACPARTPSPAMCVPPALIAPMRWSGLSFVPRPCAFLKSPDSKWSIILGCSSTMCRHWQVHMPFPVTWQFCKGCMEPRPRLEVHL